jgi:hypothetical protein
MTVKELIAQLQAQPPDADVGYIWDGALRSYVAWVWLCRGDGEDFDGPTVALCDCYEAVYPNEDRPCDAPDQETDPYWYPKDRPEPTASPGTP